MAAFFKKHKLLISGICFNVIAIALVVFTVVYAFMSFQSTSYKQNVDNLQTMTNSSSGRVSVVFNHYEEDMNRLVSFVCKQNNDEGMTYDELTSFFLSYYEDVVDVEFQVIDSATKGGTGTNEYFGGVNVSGGVITPVSYNVNYYSLLSKSLAKASEENIGTMYLNSEFVDSYSLQECSSISSPIRIKSDIDGEAPIYKSLMLLIKSSYIDELMTSTDIIETSHYEKYSSVIVNGDGDYIISSSGFQGKNLFDYFSSLDDSLTSDKIDDYKEMLTTSKFSDVYFNNAAGQNCIYISSSIDNTPWYVVSTTTVSSFTSTNNAVISYLIFFFALILLFSINFTWILRTNKKLKKISIEANQASLAKSEFLSSMSHDIRTPMNAIIGMTVIANDELKADKPDMLVIKDCLSTIDNSGNHLLTLINDILDISKIESGKIAINNESFSIAETVSKMMNIIQPTISKKRLIFEPHIFNVKHEFVTSDELRIKQIYLNILSNAIKYTKEGGKIILDFAEVPLKDNDNYAKYVFTVKDSGIGMSKEFLEHIFSRFNRAVDTRINKIQGTGLGLSITKQLMDLLGGDINVVSEINVGSTFVVTLTLPISNKIEKGIISQNLKLLVIDNDEVILDSTKVLLKEENDIVDVTTDYKKGISLAKKNKYDVILIDWKLDGINGNEVAQIIKEDKNIKSKLILITAYSTSEILQSNDREYFDLVLSKPLFKSKLINGIEQVLNRTVKVTKVHKTFHLNVLVTEDNAINYMVIEKILERYGINPRHAENGQECLEIVEQSKKFDLILMDIQMPVMNGYDATKAIRKLEDKEKASTLIYAMTADSFAEDITKCHEAGLDGHFAKPIQIDNFEKFLSEIDKKVNG